VQVSPVLVEVGEVEAVHRRDRVLQRSRVKFLAVLVVVVAVVAVVVVVVVVVVVGVPQHSLVGFSWWT